MSRTKQAALAILLACAVVLIVLLLRQDRESDEAVSLLELKVKAANLSVDYDPDQVLDDVRRLGLNTVNVPVAVLVEGSRSSVMTLDVSSLEKAQKLIPQLQRLQLRIILEPYPWIASGTIPETEWNPDSPEAFFANWREQVLMPLASSLAEPLHVDAMIAGSNLVHLEEEGETWSVVLKALREVYGGLVTYKTNWWYTASWDPPSIRGYEAKVDNILWRETDFITIAAYFELSAQTSPTTQQLTQALRSTQVNNRGQDVAEEVMRLGERWGKPVYFGELGFPARRYAAKEPWNPSPSEIYDGAGQARLFEAYRQVFSGREAFLGFSVFAVGEKSPDKHYYPSDESAEVIKAWKSG